MNQMNTNIVLLLEMLRQMLGAIDGAMLATGATERDLQVREIAFDKALHMMIDKRINGVQESENLTVFLQKINNGLIEARKGLIFVVLTGVMGRTAIEDVTSSVAGFVGRDSTLKGERVNRY